MLTDTKDLGYTLTNTVILNYRVMKQKPLLLELWQAIKHHDVR